MDFEDFEYVYDLTKLFDEEDEDDQPQQDEQEGSERA